jgi:hypothetical protein
MKLTRTFGLLVLVTSLGLSACGGGGAPTTANPQSAPTSVANAYTGPAPATADVQAFAVSFWNNVRVQNRCGQCHNATSPAQMPNFARSDDVNLAYAQANTVVNLQQPSTSRVVVKVSGGHNCWLSDPTACGAILTTWITNWANASGSSGGTKVQLVEPPLQTVGTSKNFPASSALYQQYIYTPITSVYCSKCHSPNASTAQSPFFASNNIDQAYQAAIPKIDLNTPTNSRFYERLANENHNCWSNCQQNAATMLAAIQAMAGQIQPTSIPASTIASGALNLAQGTIASGANRYDTNVIAKWEFATGSGYTAFDTSGVDPSADLTISGNVLWAGGWGLTFGAGGKAQASTSSSAKLYNMIQATGEFSVEAWVAPALVAVDNSYMVSYSGGDATRNFTLGQTNQNYDFMMRSSASMLNGTPQLATPTTAMVLQASLQHVVLTYDAVNGRQIYVNGVNTGVTDPQKGSTISNWDNTFALVLGNEVSGDRSWQGLIKFAAVHNRALTAAQVLQNFNAGVGQRYYMLFNVASITGISKAYVMFTVSQFDSYSYLFTNPTFISLDPTVTPDNVIVKGIRIGINGSVPTVGQAYIPLNVTVSANNYTSSGEVLSKVGTVIALQNGPLTDQFFLSFDQLGSKTNVTTEPQPIPTTPTDIAMTAMVGVRSFAQVNSSLSVLTGVPKTDPNVLATYQAVQQQLPTTSTLESFSAANQVGVAQLAIQYCNVAVNNPAYLTKLLPGVTVDGNLYGANPTPTQAGVTQVTSLLATRVLGTGLNSSPAASTVTGELGNLITTLCATTACNTPARAQAVTAAACAAALGNANMLIN